MALLEIKKDLKAQIEREAYFLSRKNLNYDELCWILAEKTIASERKKHGRIAKDKIKQKAEEIFKLSYRYDELCWKIAELTVEQD